MRYVLFVGNHNAGRSQVVQAFFERQSPPDLRAESAGQESAAEIWLVVIEAMAEVGIDISGRRPRKLVPEMQLHADCAVPLACGDCPYVPTTVEDWDVPDPTGRPLAEVRAIRDEIRGARHGPARAPRRGHPRGPHRARGQARAAAPRLVAEFQGVRPDAEIRACADAILGELGEAPVRSFVMTLAHRKARECLPEERCAALA